jgi:HAD superfamily hydrolase (TIGR01450 family)
LFDVALLDLDGVVYIGAHAVPGAVEALAAAKAAGMRLAYVTNNAARPPRVVAEHLDELGIAATADEVITSSQAAARYLAERLDAGARVLVVGTTGLEEALRERGLVPVSSAEDDPAAVVQGYSPTLDWAQLAEGAVAINRALPWVATNIDPTVPSSRGPLPGNGSLVAALRHATGAQPVVTGKPDPAMHRETVIRTGAKTPLVVGDRLDTDIEGANAAGCPSLLVLTGVTAADELLAAPAALRPTYLARDLHGLLQAHPAVTRTADRAHCRGWTAHAAGPELHLAWDGAACGESPAADPIDALRALCVVAWAVADAQAEDGPADRDDPAGAARATDPAGAAGAPGNDGRRCTGPSNLAGRAAARASQVVADDPAASTAVRELGLE